MKDEKDLWDISRAILTEDIPFTLHILIMKIKM